MSLYGTQGIVNFANKAQKEELPKQIVSTKKQT